MARRDHSGRTDIRLAAIKRLADARALLRLDRETAGASTQPKHTRAAAYLAGYAVECKLKAIAMEVHDAWTLDELAKKWGATDQDVYSHGLEALARRLPLYDNLTRSTVWHDFAAYVNRWRVSWRYDPRNPALDETTRFLDAVDRVYRWLEANQC